MDTIKRYIVETGEYGLLDHDGKKYKTGDILTMEEGRAAHLLAEGTLRPALEDITDRHYAPDPPAASPPAEPVAPPANPAPPSEPQAPQAPAPAAAPAPEPAPQTPAAPEQTPPAPANPATSHNDDTVETG